MLLENIINVKVLKKHQNGISEQSKIYAIKQFGGVLKSML
jgi:hypothetical protein